MTNSYPAMNPPDWGELGRIFANAFRQSPRVFQAAYTQQRGGGFEPTPAEYALSGSPLIDYVRQHLPRTIGDTALGDALPARTPDWLRATPLGGYGQERKDALREIRSRDLDISTRSYERGLMPTPDLDRIGDVPVGPSNRNKLAQLAGIASSDLVGTQGLQNLWWFLNAAPAVTSIAQLQAIHSAGNEINADGRWTKGYRRDGKQIYTPLLKSGNLRMAATTPAWIGINFATGAFGRQPGYAASVPSEDDPRVTANPVAEILSRAFLNREGKLLKYDEFVKERPDVSKGEYQAYKAYLFGNPSPIKATLDGIHGPEVTFLGKSIPLLTGIAPAVAGIVGARRGARMAARRLADDPRGNQIEQRDHAFATLQALKKSSRDPSAAVKTTLSPQTRALIAKAEEDNAFQEYNRLNKIVEGETLKQVLAWSGGSFTAAGLLGSTLESIRRSMRGEIPQDELEPLLVAPPPVRPLPAAPVALPQ